MPTVAIRLLAAAVPGDPWDNPSTWPTWRQLLPHVLAANEDTLTRRRQVLGRDHPDTLRSAIHLAADLHALGQHERARQLAEDTLARFRRVLGDDHPDTVLSANNLDTVLRVLGHDEQASQLDEWIRSCR